MELSFVFRKSESRRFWGFRPYKSSRTRGDNLYESCRRKASKGTQHYSPLPECTFEDGLGGEKLRNFASARFNIGKKILRRSIKRSECSTAHLEGKENLGRKRISKKRAPEGVRSGQREAKRKSLQYKRAGEGCSVPRSFPRSRGKDRYTVTLSPQPEENR